MTGSHWCRVQHDGRPHIGRLQDDHVALYQGDLFDRPTPTSVAIAIEEASWLPPVEPRQFLGLWNNFRERQRLENTRTPDFPLYFAKLGASLSAHGQTIARPTGYEGAIKFEAELGIVVGRRCYCPSPESAADAIFGYTCVNDVTAADPLFANPEFQQWCRAKSYPGFGPIGPSIATGIDPAELRVRAVLDDEVRQDYPVSDMIFGPTEIVWHIAQELMLLPGDVIACGTSVGAGVMGTGQIIEIDIPGVGRLINTIV